MVTVGDAKSGIGNMSGRSVIETLDLHNDYGEYHSEACTSQAYGWLSPRISFSTDFLSMSSDRASPEKKAGDDTHNSSPSPTSSLTASPTDFEFSLSSFKDLGGGSPGFIVPADELFHQGKLLPGFLPPISGAKDTNGSLEPNAPPIIIQDVPIDGSSTAIGGHLNAEANGGQSSQGCVLGPSCLRASKGPKWRELFGALRRVKSDSGRQRDPDESLLPPKTLQGRRRFFKQLFSPGNANGNGNANGSGAADEDPKLSSAGGPRYSSASAPTPGLLSGDQERSTSGAWESSFSGRTLSKGSSSAAAATSTAPQLRSRSPPTSVPAVQLRSDDRGGECKADAHGKSCEQSSEGFTFNPTPGKVKQIGSHGGGASAAGGGGAGAARSANSAKTPARGANLGRSPSGRVIVRSLDRVSSGRNSAVLQEQVRALRSREIRRSPDRSGYSSVRVTPVLNVPVCMGPVLRGATKAGKGRLSNFRSFLNFKSKLPTSMSAAPIVTGAVD